MGFFSWNCNECKHPMLSIWSTNSINSWMSSVIVIESDGGGMRGEYDGYGRVDGREINLDTEPCCYHDACWVKAGEPTSYSPSEYAEDQGYFFDDEHDVHPPT